MAQDWFDQIAAPVQQPTAPPPQPSAAPPGVIYGRPKQLAPVDPLDAAIKGLTIRDKQLDITERNTPSLPSGYRWKNGIVGGDQEPIPGGPNDPATKAGTEDDRKVVMQNANLDALAAQINRVQELFNQSQAGRGISSIGEYLPTSDNKQFDAAAAGLAEQGMAAFRVPGVGAQSDTELKQFVEANKPSSKEFDSANLERLRQLRARVDSVRASLGLAPAEWVGIAQSNDTGNWTKEQSVAKWGEELYDENRNPLGPDGGPSFDAQGNPKGLAVDAPQQQDVASGTGAPSAASEAAQGFMAGVGDVVQGLGNIPGLVANPANATINQIFGTNLSTDLGMALRQALSLPDNPNRVASQINQAGAGALGLSGLAGTAAKGATGALSSALDIAAAQPGRQAAAAAIGGGTSEQLRQEGASPLAQLGGGLLAGGLTYSGGNALMNTVQRAAGQPNALLAAGQRQGVDILPADAGGPAVRRLTAAAAQAPVSAGPVTNAAQRSREQLGSAVSRTANREGAILEPDVAGEQVRAAGKRYVSNESIRVGRLYEQAGNSARGVRIKPLQAVAQIDEQLARYEELGEVGAPIVRTLEGIRSGIENGVSVQGMRDARTILSQGVYDGKLRSGQEKKVMGDIIEALSSDIELGLRQAGREGAARQFKRADTLWRERIQYIDETLEPIIGKGRSGEDILGALDGMTRGQRGGVSRLRGIMREMPAEEAGNIRATVIDRLGRATASQQDDTGAAFSAETFLTNWNKMSPRAKAIMFADDGLRSNLDDIAKLANATREAGRYANRSNTAGGIIGQAGATGGLAYISPSAAAVTLGSQYLTGRLLASPRFTAWLARAPKNESAQGRYVDQLSSLAAKEPVIASDARALQQYLTETLGGSGMKAAASGNGENPRPEPKQ